MVKLRLAIKNFIQSQTGQILLGALLCHIFILPILLITLSNTLASISQDTFIDNVRFTSNLIGEQFNKEIQEGDNLVNMLDSVFLGSEIVFIEFVHPLGNLVPSIVSADELPDFSEDFNFDQNGDNIYFISIPIGFSQEQFLRIGFDELPTVELIETIIFRLFLFVLVYAIGFLVVMLWWGKRVFYPISVLREILHRITTGDLDHKIEVKSSLQEVRALSADMETMRSTLVRKTFDFEQLSKQDVLTLLPNRAALADRLDQAIKDSYTSRTRFCVGIMDFDNFKEVNDNFGHNVGDLVLQEAALRMQNSVRSVDTIARLGGDEFAFLIYDASPTFASQCIEDISNEIMKTYHVQGHVITFGCSTGISCYPEDGIIPTDLLRKADVAMYEAKNNNEGLCVYRSELDYERSRKVQLKADLKKALNENQLIAHYQPKFNLQTGKLDSLEALLRWEHPENGLIYPDAFIGLAEENYLINDLSLWLIRKIGTDFNYFDEHGLTNISIALNISPRSLLEESFAQKLLEIMQELEIDPHRIELELTENDIISDPLRAEGILDFCSKQGMSVAIDDFGSGYSSMNYLKNYPIDTLKIDKSFVMDLSKNETNSSIIVRASIELAHNLGIKVVAEGVESKEAMQLLHSWNCDYGQGNLFSRPLPREELVKAFKNSAMPKALAASGGKSAKTA